MINATFDYCVWILNVLADLLGITYQAINVWIFVVLWPLLTLALIAIIFGQQVTIRRLIGERRPAGP
jgi:hypothetical protein